MLALGLALSQVPPSAAMPVSYVSVSDATGSFLASLQLDVGRVFRVSATGSDEALPSMQRLSVGRKGGGHLRLSGALLRSNASLGPKSKCNRYSTLTTLHKRCTNIKAAG